MSNMNLYRERLPGTDLEVSNVAFGTYKLGMKLGAAAAVDLMGHAYNDHGINMIDTSDNYPAAELIIGQAFRDKVLPRDEIVVAAKTGLAGPEYEHNEFMTANKRVDTSPDRLQHKVEESLRVMGIDEIDLYQLHGYDPKVSPADLAYTMTELIRGGKVRYWGVCNYTKVQLQELLDTCMATGLIQPVTYQQYHNMANRPFEDDIKHANSKGLGVLAFSPLAKGAVTGEYATVFSSQNREDVEDKKAYDQAVALSKLHELAQGQGFSLQQMAIAWSLGNKNVDVTLLGAYKAEHLDDLIQGTTLTLDDDLQKRADALYKQLLGI